MTTQHMRTYRIGSLDRALLVLEALAELRDGVTLAELAERTDIPRGSLFRHLSVLSDWGFVRQSPETKRDTLGAQLIYLGFVARERLRLPKVGSEAMRRLHVRFNDTVHLGVLSQAEVVHVAMIESSHPVKMASAVGDRTWVHVSTLGKALLAWGADELVGEVVRDRGLPRLTARTVFTRAALDHELAVTRTRGFAIDDEESAEGLRCVAARIQYEPGTVLGALSISAPADRVSRTAAEEAGSHVAVGAAEVSARLGWRPVDPPPRTAEMRAAA